MADYTASEIPQDADFHRVDCVKESPWVLEYNSSRAGWRRSPFDIATSNGKKPRCLPGSPPFVRSRDREGRKHWITAAKNVFAEKIWLYRWRNTETGEIEGYSEPAAAADAIIDVLNAEMVKFRETSPLDVSFPPTMVSLHVRPEVFEILKERQWPSDQLIEHGDVEMVESPEEAIGNLWAPEYGPVDLIRPEVRESMKCRGFPISSLEGQILSDGARRIVSDFPKDISDRVNHPPHYKAHPSGIECIQITEHLNFCIGNAMKYLWRADQKGDPIEDLEKAKWYIQREIDRRRR